MDELKRLIKAGEVEKLRQFDLSLIDDDDIYSLNYDQVKVILEMGYDLKYIRLNRIEDLNIVQLCILVKTFQ